MVRPQQIDEDLALLARYTDCIRTYSIENGLDQVPEIARRHGLKVLHGIWVSNKRQRPSARSRPAVALAKKYPGRHPRHRRRQRSAVARRNVAADLVAIIREVKSQVAMPVTYADVWEFWLRYARHAERGRFRHHPYPAVLGGFSDTGAVAAAHVEAIRKRRSRPRSRKGNPDRRIRLAERRTACARAQGRRRRTRRASSQETMALAKRENFRVNVIEAFDQPWKRALEGAAGGYWGIFDRGERTQRNSASAARYPTIRNGAAGRSPESLLAALIFGAAWVAARQRRPRRVAVAADRRAGAPAPRSCSAGPSRRCRSKATASAPGCDRSPLRWPPRRRRSPARRPAPPAGTRPTFAVLTRSRRVRARACLSVALGARLDRAYVFCRADGARPGVRSALSRSAVCAAKRRGSAPFLMLSLATPRRPATAPVGRDGRRRRAGAFGGLHRAQ